MQELADLDLPHLAMEDPAFSADPLPHFRVARERHPWLATSNFGLVIHDYTAIRELLPQDELFRNGYGAMVEMGGGKGTPWGRFTEEQLLALPGDQHKLIRHTFAAQFTPRVANQLRPLIERTIGDLLDEWAPRGGFDFVELAAAFPIQVMFWMIGAPPDRMDEVRDDLETLASGFAMDPALLPSLNAAVERLDAFAFGLMEARRADPDAAEKRDLLALLIDTAAVGKINDRVFADLLIVLFAAGYDTTKNMLSAAMWLMIDHPEVYERCAEDADYCGRVIEEVLRYITPASVGRIAREDIVYRGVRLPKDTMMFFALNVSGRDDRAFADAETFDPDREADRGTRHVAFGLGRHMCLGQYLARVELQEGLHQVARRLRKPRLVGEIGWRPFQGIWGVRSLPIAFTPS